jgi:hypothetical protein
MGDVSSAPWRVIVRPDLRELYLDLQRRFETDPRVAIILDRRQASRRVAASPPETERRRRDRRGTPSGRTLDLTAAAGIRVEEGVAMAQWEYRFEEIYPREASRINRLGEDGWEAVSTSLAHGGEPVKCLVLFKRPKRD